MAIGLHFKMAQVSSQTGICPSPHESHVSQNHGLVVTEKLFEGALRAGPSHRNYNSSCKFSYSTSCILQRGNHDTLALEEKRFQTLNSLQATLLLHLQSPEIATCEFTSSQFYFALANSQLFPAIIPHDTVFLVLSDEEILSPNDLQAVDSSLGPLDPAQVYPSYCC